MNEPLEHPRTNSNVAGVPFAPQRRYRRMYTFGRGLRSFSSASLRLYRGKVLSAPARYLRLTLGLVRGDRTDRAIVLRQIGRIRGLSRAVGNHLAPVQSYSAMQRATYEQAASAELVRPGDIVTDFVVGSWREHDAWADYEEYLMLGVPRDASWLALDFGCGPGRNIRRWSDRFARIDGVDISRANLANAETFLRGEIAPTKRPFLYLASGSDCGAAPSDYYDLVFSTICLQHICVHSVRLAIFRDMFRCIKPGGRISVQMGFGVPSPDTVSYYADFTAAQGTNRACDVAIETSEQIADDLSLLGFHDYRSAIRPVGPGDRHPNWIFFSASKPRNGGEGAHSCNPSVLRNEYLFREGC